MGTWGPTDKANGENVKTEKIKSGKGGVEKWGSGVKFESWEKKNR